VRPRKLTDADNDWIRSIVLQRRSIPSNQQIADQLGVCKRIIDEVTGSMRQKTETNGVNATPLYEVRG
jgi:hypothetical protein